MPSTVLHSSMRSEVCTQLGLAVPYAFANLLDRATQWISWSLVGHLGPDYLGPASTASSVNNVLGTSVTIGMAMAVSTLASQSHGANDMNALNFVLQRSIPISFCFSLPCVVLLLMLKPLLLSTGMDAAFALRTGQYAVTIVPVTVFAGIVRCFQVWLAAQGYTRPTLLINLTVLPGHVALCYGLVNHTPLGFLGAGCTLLGSNSGLAGRCASIRR